MPATLVLSWVGLHSQHCASQYGLHSRGVQTGPSWAWCLYRNSPPPSQAHRQSQKKPSIHPQRKLRSDRPPPWVPRPGTTFGPMQDRGQERAWQTGGRRTPSSRQQNHESRGIVLDLVEQFSWGGGPLPHQALNMYPDQILPPTQEEDFDFEEYDDSD